MGGGNGAKPCTNNGRIAVSVKDSNSKAFIVHVDPSDISYPVDNTTKPEFAGLATDLAESILSDTIENLKWEGWLALEELKTSLDWTKHTRDFDIAAISEIAPLQQSKGTPLSLDDLPFYINMGATINISPEQSDFMTL